MANERIARIEVGPSESRLLNTEVYGPISDALAVRGKGYMYTKAYKSGRWDGYHRFFNIKTGVFPTGMLPAVRYMLLTGQNAEDGKVVLPNRYSKVLVRFLCPIPAEYANLLLEDPAQHARRIVMEDLPIQVDENGRLLL